MGDRIARWPGEDGPDLDAEEAIARQPGHPADTVSVSGRPEPVDRAHDPARHEVRVTAELEFRGTATIPVIRLSCTGCPGWRRSLYHSYPLDGITALQPQHDGSGT